MKEYKILIQGAMDIELKYILENLKEKEEIIIDDYTFFTGKLYNHDVAISKTGIGMVNATISTLIGIKHFNPQIILNQGIAGGIGENIHKFDILLGESSANIGAFDIKSRKKGEGNYLPDWKLCIFNDGEDEKENIFIKCNENLLKLANSIKYEKGKLYNGIIGSSDMFNREVDRLIYLNENYNISGADMETAAVYTVCRKFHKSVLGIRVISDNEALGETYEKDIADYSAKFTLELCKKVLLDEGEK